MRDDVVILLAEDDEGHAILVRENLAAAGLKNRIEHFRDGQAILDFLFGTGPEPKRDPHQPYVLLLDIRMPKIDGIEVLRLIKIDRVMRKLPVIMLTTTDDFRDVSRCYDLGCNIYMKKPVDYDRFTEAILKLGKFISVLKVAELDRAEVIA